MHGALDEDLRFLQVSLEGLAKSLQIDTSNIDALRTQSATLLSSAELSRLGDTPDFGGAQNLLQMSVITETIGASCTAADFLNTSLLGPHLLACAESSARNHPLVASGQRLAVGFDTNLSNVAYGTSMSMAAVDVGLGPHTILHLDHHCGTLLASSLPADAPSSSEDLARRISRLSTADGVPIGSISPVALERWVRYAHIAISSELLGLMQGALDMAVAYAKSRTQFGKPIGQFQAIQHILAESHARVEAVRSIVRNAADEEDHKGARTHLAKAAKITASEASIDIIESCIQIHGGLGHTWEYPLHLYLRRALVDRQLLGDESSLLTELAHDLFDEARQT